jgi:hypothetical protein
MASQYADFPQVVKESACTMLRDPGAISEFIVAEVLGRGRAKDVNMQDAKELIRDYLTVLCGSR